jgi:photosystem II stability/assembly factor-like uncharacterized protein
MNQALRLGWGSLVAVWVTACSGSTTNPPTTHDAGEPDASGAMSNTARDAAVDHGADAAAPRADDGGKPPLNPCVAAGTCAPGEWIDVTPDGVDLADQLGCGNYGAQTMQRDPARAGDLYTLFMCQGIWKSTDYGETWTGPINTGAQGAVMGDCAGGITVARGDDGAPLTIYAACIRGTGIGFWSSTNAGLDWTRYEVEPGADRQDFYPPVVDPYDATHLLMAGHEMNLLVESFDAGHTWQSVMLDAGMNENGGTAGIFFIDTGNAATTRKTFLWIAQQSDQYGTWRTADAGMTWTRVDKNEHPHGLSQIYQPDTGGVVYMAGAYSMFGWGVLRSADYGETWQHVGNMGGQAVVFGTAKNVYAMSSGAVGLGGMLDPTLELAPQPGTGMWTSPGTPAAMTIGAAQAAVVHDGTHAIVVTANWGAGLWRYVEP